MSAPTVAPEPARFGVDAPAWARGKTAVEVLGIAQQMIDAFGRGGPQAPAAPAPTSTNIMRDAGAPTFGDDDFVTGKDVRALAASVTPSINQSIDLASSANFGYIRREFAKEFQRYGPEITQRLAQVPRHLWTIDNLETVVKLVKVDHLDDLARDRATEIMSTMEPTIRSTGVVGSVPVPASKDASLESDKIPAEWKARAARAGLTESHVEEFCKANEMSREAFYKQFDTPFNAIVQESGKVKETVG